ILVQNLVLCIVKLQLIIATGPEFHLKIINLLGRFRTIGEMNMKMTQNILQVVIIANLGWTSMMKLSVRLMGQC
ncbi:hypothetical protein VIGAN_02152700, partial [Vigna angularis var. angularis]